MSAAYGPSPETRRRTGLLETRTDVRYEWSGAVAAWKGATSAYRHVWRDPLDFNTLRGIVPVAEVVGFPEVRVARDRCEAANPHVDGAVSE